MVSPVEGPIAFCVDVQYFANLLLEKIVLSYTWLYMKILFIFKPLFSFA